MDAKRKADDHAQDGAVVKRVKESDGSLIVSQSSSNSGGALMKTLQRTSSLQAPIMLLTGHTGEVFTSKFSLDGQHIASGSNDKSIYLWNTYGDCSNYNVLKGHQGAVLEVQWSRDNNQVFSASTDKTLGIWDASTGARIKKIKGHHSFINTLSVSRKGPELLVSGSDDSSIRVWDPRAPKRAAHMFQEKYQVTAVAFGDEHTVFSGGIDNEIKVWDLRKGAVSYELRGHLDTITGLRLSPDGGFLLSNAMDNTVRIWDVKPFAAGATSGDGGSGRMLKIFEGAPQGMEKHLLRPCWSAEGDMIAAGAADRSVVVWDVMTRKILYKLPGHKGCVTEVDWHPTEPVLLSCSNDKNIFIGEINPSEARGH
ncbi:hypothetical protein HDV05_008019 [Chytridiales sp. JEL 0842]|nr:hypothetical protein HDV05_008019 [Chytridiales sp. JEL 0842]